MLFCTCKIHFKINNEKQKLVISRFIFLSKNFNPTLGFGVKIQNSILEQKSKFTFFSIFIFILNWKSKDTFHTCIVLYTDGAQIDFFRFSFFH